MDSLPKRRKLDLGPTDPVDSSLTQTTEIEIRSSIPLFVFTLVIEFVEEQEFHSLIRAVPSLYNMILTQSSHSACNTLFTLRYSEHVIQRRQMPIGGVTRLYPPQPFVRRLRATLVVFDYPKCLVGMNDEPPTNTADDGISGTVSAEFCGSEKYVEEDYYDLARNIGVSDEVGSGWDSIGLDCGCMGSMYIARRFPELRELVIDVRHSTCDGNSRMFETEDEIQLKLKLRELGKLEIVQFEVGALFPISGFFHPYDLEKLKKSMASLRGPRAWLFSGRSPPKHRRHSLEFCLSGLSNLREIRCGFNSRDVKVQCRGECPPVFEVRAYNCPKLERMITERPLHCTSSLVFMLSPPYKLPESFRELKGCLQGWMRSRSTKSAVLHNLESLGIYTVPLQWMNSYKLALGASQLPSLRKLECIGAVKVDLDRLTEFANLEELTFAGLEKSTMRQVCIIPNLPNLRVLEVLNSDKTRIDALPNLESLVIQETIVSVKSEILSRLRRLKIVGGILLSPDADPDACRRHTSLSEPLPLSVYLLPRSTPKAAARCITKITPTQFPSLEEFMYTVLGQGDYFWEILDSRKLEGISEIEDGIASLQKVAVDIQVAQEGEFSRWNEEGFVVPSRFESQVRVVKLTD